MTDATVHPFPDAAGKEVQKWADEAMYESEPMPFNVNETGPKVTLLSATPDPLGAIAAMSMIYEGRVCRDLSDVTDDERRHYFDQIKKTHLKAPFEAVDLHFLVEGVTRSFTHQMVRQRTAVYAQESLRFAVKETIDEEVALPPSLAGLPADDPRAVLWRQAVNAVDDRYHALVDAGIPAEDARGLLPHNITTRLHYKTNLRGLYEHLGNRLCTQAQFEWRAVATQIIKAIREYAKCICDPVSIGYPEQNCDYHGQPGFTKTSGGGWQFNEIANLFRPICYLTGKCEFKADFDRKCKIRDRVDANAKAGRPSERWDKPFTAGEAGAMIHGIDSPEDVGEIYIPAIHPAEWLADPTAAR